MTVTIMFKSNGSNHTGKFHTADYLKVIGVPDIPPSTSPFDPEYDPSHVRGSLGAEFPPHVDSEDLHGLLDGGKRACHAPEDCCRKRIQRADGNWGRSLRDRGGAGPTPGLP